MVRFSTIGSQLELFPPKEKPYDHVGAIIAYEQNELDGAECLELFAYLIKTGLAWSLQGHYGRTAKGLIESGRISPAGDVLDAGDDD